MKLKPKYKKGQSVFLRPHLLSDDATRVFEVTVKKVYHINEVPAYDLETAQGGFFIGRVEAELGTDPKPMVKAARLTLQERFEFAQRTYYSRLKELAEIVNETDIADDTEGTPV